MTQDNVTRVRAGLDRSTHGHCDRERGRRGSADGPRRRAHRDTSKQLENLPVPLGRNYQNLFVTVPGISPPENMHSVAVNPARGLGFNSNGTTRNANAIRIEGAISNNLWLPHVAVYVPALEAIETVSVVTSSFDADLGLSGGMSANVVIKSGTNAFRGSMFGYHFNEKLKARPYFLPASEEKPEARQNQFGGTLGGPIVRTSSSSSAATKAPTIVRRRSASARYRLTRCAAAISPHRPIQSTIRSQARRMERAGRRFPATSFRRIVSIPSF